MLTTQFIDPTAATEPGFDLHSIKSLMDNFDPAAMLPELESVFGKLSSVCRLAVMLGPVIMLILGIAYLVFMPKEANYYFGYRCYYGMGSVRAWQFSQRLAGAAFAGVGLILTGIMFTVSGGFASMELNAMAWRAVKCLAWQAGIVLLVNLGINLATALTFNRKGEKRKGKKRRR